MRSPAVDPQLAPALAAYATDLTLIGTALRPMDGVGQRGNVTAFTSAVTSHTIWFHRPFRTDDWLLLRQHSPLLAHGHSFGGRDMLAEDGTLVASEILKRFPEWEVDSANASLSPTSTVRGWDAMPAFIP
jgi:acyl-CoA thioesterase-2